MALMTQREYAERKDVTPQYISKLVAQGKIRRVGRKIDSRQADAALKSTRERVLTSRRTAGDRVAQKSKAARSKAAHKAAKSKSAEVKQPRTSATRSLTEARAAREHYQAEMAKLDYEKAVGELLPRKQVVDDLRDYNMQIKMALRRLPRSLAPALARIADPAEVESVLLAEVDLLLERLSGNPFGEAEPAPPGPPMMPPPPVPETTAQEVAA